MKSTTVILSLFLLSSCASTKYNVKKGGGNFTELQAGKTYVFFDKSDLKTKMEIISIDQDSIIGLNNKNRIALAKNSISKVKKNNTAGTVILVGTSVGFVVATYVIFKAVVDIGRGFGHTIAGQ